MFKQWYRDAERVLKIDHAEYFHDVMPVVLSREAMRMLHKHLARASRDSRTGFSKRDLIKPNADKG